MGHYIKKKIDREDQRILNEIFTASYDNNQVKILELLEEMNSTSDEIRKNVIELKKTLANLPDDNTK